MDDYIDGFAVRGDKGVMLSTVAKTRRMAIVRWLMETGGVLLLSTRHSDEEVEKLWAEYGGDRTIAQVRVYSHG